MPKTKKAMKVVKKAKKAAAARAPAMKAMKAKPKSKAKAKAKPKAKARVTAPGSGVVIRGSCTEIFELAGLYYQVLGYVWDHEVKDFKVLYRPLYDCHAKAGSFEAHNLAVSHFSRWEEKFTRVVDLAGLPQEVSSFLSQSVLLSPPPFSVGGAQSAVVAAPSRACTRSGHGTRSFEKPSVESIVGDYRGFIDALLAQLTPVMDVSSFEMDHICYRCESVDEYRRVCGALCPALGEVLTENEIGGRPIATIRLWHPIEHAGYKVKCIEVPCPKAGRAYTSGLEHAELVVGSEGDGMVSNTRLKEFMGQHPTLSFDTKAMDKEINADVSLSFETKDWGPISVKFHQRPLYEVVAYELQLEKGGSATGKLVA